jgi:colanic acid/amylovoran biosynthesis glycosyltransferase
MIQDPLSTTAIETGFSDLLGIATRRAACGEVIENETNGLLVEARGPAELADAMCRLLDDPQLQLRLAGNARRRATERFGRERFLNEFIELLEEEE